MPNKYKFSWESQEAEQPDDIATEEKVREGVGTTVRTASGLAIPVMIRLGTGWASNMGGLAGAGISGAGELVAQMIEEGTLNPLSDKINKSRVTAEAMLGGVPMGRFFKAGKALAGAGFGGALAGAGVLGRKITDEDPNAIKDWGAWDAGQIALGAGMGALGAKIPVKNPESAAEGDRFLALVRKSGGNRNNLDPTELAEFDALAQKGYQISRNKDGVKGPDSVDRPSIVPVSRQGQKATKATEKQIAIDEAVNKPVKSMSMKDVLNTGKHRPDAPSKWSADKIDETATRLEALGGPTFSGAGTTNEDAARLLREAAAQTGAGNTKIYGDVLRLRNRDITQEARNANAVEKFKKGEIAQEMKNENARDKFVAGEVKKYQQDEVKGQKALNDDAAANVLVREGQEQVARTNEQAAEVARRLAALEAQGARPQTVVTKTSTAETPDANVKATTVFKVGGKGNRGRGGEDAPTGGATPLAGAAPVIQQTDTFQLVNPDGRVIAELTDEATAEQMLNAAGRGFRIIPPKATKAVESTPAAAKAAETVPEAAPVAEQPKSVIEEILEAPQPAKPPVDVTETAPVVPTVPVKAEVPVEVPPAQPTAVPVTEAPTAGAAPVADTGNIRLSPPLWERILEASKLPEGHQFARFFRTPQQAEVAKQYQDTLPPEVSDLFAPILAQYEAQLKKLPGLPESFLHTKAGDNPAKRNLGEMLAMMRDELGIPVRPVMPKPGSEVRGGKVRAPRVVHQEVQPQETLEDVLMRPGGRAPQELLDRAAELSRRRDAILNDPTLTPEQRAALGEAIGKEADDLQLQILRVEMEAERAMKKPPTDGSSGGGGGGTPIGFGLGGAQDIMEIIQRNPDFAAQLAGGAIGATAGAVADEDEPWFGAMLGGTAGALGARGIREAMTNPNFMEDAKDTARAWTRRLPNIQRGALLADVQGLGINAGLAPWGAGMMGSTERIAQGLLERMLPSQVPTNALDEGIEGIRNLVNPVSYLRRVPNSIDEASMMLQGANERGEMLLSEAPTAFDKMISTPSTIMATGDVTARSALMDAGLTENAARSVTLTANPRTKAGEGIVDFAKKSPYLAMLQPFSRTAVNIVESGIERTPLWLMVKDNPQFAASAAQIAARNGLSGATAFIAYNIGNSVDPETARAWHLPKVVSNMAGQYGAIASMAYAAGMAEQLGRNPQKAALTDGLRNLPLPTTQLVEDDIKAIINYSQPLLGGELEPIRPNAEYPFQRWLPRGLMPTMLSDRNISDMTETFQNFKFSF